MDCCGIFSAAIHEFILRSPAFSGTNALQDYPIIAGYNEQHHINAANACQHIADKSLMAWNVHKTEADGFSLMRRQFKMSKSYVDGNAALFSLFEAVGVNAG
jgi:hypothetical protein